MADPTKYIFLLSYLGGPCAAHTMHTPSYGPVCGSYSFDISIIFFSNSANILQIICLIEDDFNYFVTLLQLTAKCCGKLFYICFALIMFSFVALDWNSSMSIRELTYICSAFHHQSGIKPRYISHTQTHTFIHSHHTHTHLTRFY